MVPLLASPEHAACQDWLPRGMPVTVALPLPGAVTLRLVPHPPTLIWQVVDPLPPSVMVKVAAVPPAEATDVFIDVIA